MTNMYIGLDSQGISSHHKAMRGHTVYNNNYYVDSEIIRLPGKTLANIFQLHGHVHCTLDFD